MSINIINKAIIEMCSEVESNNLRERNWRSLNEEELLYELAVCIFCSQLTFELALSMADRLQKSGYLTPKKFSSRRELLEKVFLDELEKPLIIKDRNGTARKVRARFKNRLSKLLSRTIENIYGNQKSIKKLLLAAESPNNARQLLIESVCGFGPKQASLYLRRISYCSDLAVIDTHILDYLKLYDIAPIPYKNLGKLHFYESIENKFRDIATDLNKPVGLLDLATWVTMRVAKREALL